jgi:putative endonuclease
VVERLMSLYKVYILKSLKNNRHYIGVTSDLTDRIKRHNGGQNPSTKSGCPWRLIYTEDYLDKQSAWQRERQIKRYKGGGAFKRLVVDR